MLELLADRPHQNRAHQAPPSNWISPESKHAESVALVFHDGPGAHTSGRAIPAELSVGYNNPRVRLVMAEQAQTATILIVDDDEGVTQTFARMLRLEGYQRPDGRERRNGLREAAETSARTPSSSTCGCRSSTGWVSCAASARSDEQRAYAGRDRHRATTSWTMRVRRNCSSSGAELKFKPLWLEDLVGLARNSSQGDPLTDSDRRFLKACRRQPVDATPVWFMRQAGRYMSEYRALRERYSLLELCRTPDLATEVTLQPVRRIEVDAAILFSDLLLPLEPMGIRVRLHRGEGPAIENPIESRSRHRRGCSVFEPREALAHVLEAIRQIKQELGGRVPLIGFAGAPFTLASYAIEGGHSNNFARHQVADVRPSRRLASPLRPVRRSDRPTTSSRRSRPASTSCRCSTRGSAR